MGEKREERGMREGLVWERGRPPPAEPRLRAAFPHPSLLA